MLFVFKVFTWTISPGVIGSIRDPFMVPRVIDNASVLECKGSIAIELEAALFGFYIRLPACVIKYIKKYYMWVVVVFPYETNACKFSMSFNFCGK